MRRRVKIAVVGDFNPEFHSHHATNAALRAGAERLGLDLELEWAPTPEVTEERLERSDGVWLAPGSPYSSKENALAAVELARRRDWPFTGS